MLTVPGALLPDGAHRIEKLNYSTARTVLLVVAVNVVMLVLLEVPLLRFAYRSKLGGRGDRPSEGVDRPQGRRSAVTMVAVLGGLLGDQDSIELLS